MSFLNGKKIVLSYSGIGELLRGEEMKQMVTEYASGVAQRAGVGFEFRVHNTGQRQAANVFPTTREASRENLLNNTLLKAVK